MRLLSPFSKLVLMVAFLITLVGLLLFGQLTSQSSDMAYDDGESVQWVEAQPVKVAVNWNNMISAPSGAKTFTTVTASSSFEG